LKILKFNSVRFGFCLGCKEKKKKTSFSLFARLPLQNLSFYLCLYNKCLFVICCTCISPAKAPLSFLPSSSSLLFIFLSSLANFTLGNFVSFYFCCCKPGWIQFGVDPIEYDDIPLISFTCTRHLQVCLRLKCSEVLLTYF